jgi:hypothetical protein
MKFGKREHQFDDRTLLLSEYIRGENLHPPTNFNFDKARSPIPFHKYGTDEWRCDVIAAQAHQLMRFYRVRKRQTLVIQESDVIDRYRSLTGAKSAGDRKDTGLSALDAFRDWRRFEWMIGGKFPDNGRIFAYGELEPNDRMMMRLATYLFTGIYIGLWLPKGVDSTMPRWDWAGQNGNDWKPGSRGGLLSYCKAYTSTGYELIVGEKKIFATNEFVEKFCDEAWAVLYSLSDDWVPLILDVPALTATLEAVRSHAG